MNALTVLFLLALANPDLQKVHTVYLLSMSNSMDQYLANRLTTESVMQVVTDPEKADAVLTDRLGLAFEERLKQLYPPPSPPPIPADEKDKDKEKDKKKNDLASALSSDEAAPKTALSSRPARGNFFLVDRRTKQVIWSTYTPSKDTSAHQLSHTAARVVEQLKKDLNPNPSPKP